MSVERGSESDPLRSPTLFAEYWERAVGGDPTAVDEIIAFVAAIVRAAAAKRRWSEKAGLRDTDEIVQEAILIVLRQIREEGPAARSPGPYAYSLGLRGYSTVKQRREKAARDGDYAFEMRLVDFDPPDNGAAREIRDAIIECCRSIQPADCRILTLHHLAGTSYREIARLLGLGQNHTFVTRRVADLHRILRPCLRRKGAVP